MEHHAGDPTKQMLAFVLPIDDIQDLVGLQGLVVVVVLFLFRLGVLMVDLLLL